MPKNQYEIWLKATRQQLAAAAVKAEPLVEQGQFDEAETLLRTVNSDIYGAVALGHLFTQALERCVRSAQPDRARAAALYERALRWRSAWPGVHTAEEAAAEEAHGEEVKAELQLLMASLPEST
jgi:hypothetical protein